MTKSMLVCSCLLPVLIALPCAANDNGSAKITCSSAIQLIDKILSQFNSTSSADTQVAFAKAIIYIGEPTQDCPEVNLRVAEAREVVKKPNPVAVPDLTTVQNLCGGQPCTIIKQPKKQTFTGLTPQGVELRIDELKDRMNNLESSMQKSRAP
ncbi:hypothetical protein I9018_11515 [Pseudomonas sp. MPFS]|uniref:hypothetical protein n=1 Tax=Pseudomonas sp. MPFS TaxID=2795724 RepID=UPI001F14295F|nr:hypothetical protein [Pseudomonas sp. MPFS]UMZ14268.1 hypothetical protein I9018_11515 [Pseudomonas sp. MPFS]